MIRGQASCHHPQQIERVPQTLWDLTGVKNGDYGFDAEEFSIFIKIVLVNAYIRKKGSQKKSKIQSSVGVLFSASAIDTSLEAI